MKVGILTFHDAHNYGAVLQAYALKKHIEKLGIDVRIVNYHHYDIPDGYPKIRKMENRWKKNSLKEIIKEIDELIYSHVEHSVRWHKFNKFIKELVDHEEIMYRSEQELEKLDIDFWICGSDQIWNTDITRGMNKGFFLDFETKGKKISYAVSMEFEELPKEYEEEFKRCINSLDYISVREESLEKYAKKFTDKQVEKVVDPTLLLEESEYEELIEENKYGDYILIYALGPDERLTKIAKKMADRENMKIIELNDRKRKHYFCNQISNAGPQEFLSLIKHANIVITNSFHGTIFSILFKKEFYTITRGNRNSRMENILNIVEMRDRLIENVKDVENVKVQDYQKASENLEKEIEKSKEFLRNALS